MLLPHPTLDRITAMNWSKSIPTVQSTNLKMPLILTGTMIFLQRPQQIDDATTWVSKRLLCFSLIFWFWRVSFMVFILIAVPDGTDNERLGCTQFIQNYRERYVFLIVAREKKNERLTQLQWFHSIRRYGEPYPHFFEGTLEEALGEACHKPAKDVSHLKSTNKYASPSFSYHRQKYWSQMFSLSFLIFYSLHRMFAAKTASNLFASRQKCVGQCVLWSCHEERYHSTNDRA